MKMIKKLSIAALVLSSQVAFAGGMGEVCKPGDVTVPCPTTAWDFGIQGLYLESITNNSAYTVFNTGSLTGVRLFDEFNYDFEWGFRLEGSYHFTNGNDLTVNWTYWRDGDKERLTPNTGSILGGAGTLRDEFTGKREFDAVNIEFGQHVDFGPLEDIRFHAGFQFARIDNKLNQAETITGSGSPFDGTLNYNQHSKFNGAGPRAGLNMAYSVANAVSLYGNLAAALLVGESKYYADFPFIDWQPGDTRLTPQRSNYTTVVPEIDVELGAKYTKQLSQGTLTLNVGYMVTNYFNPLHISTLNRVFGENDSTNQNINFGLHGLTFGAKLVV
jgi:Legionella pneumophila major outer membrane protein precursor